MKTNELRIGNYLLDMAGGRVEVRGTTSKGVWIRDNGAPASITFFKPIPLTEEWLLKLGFKKWKTLDIGLRRPMHYLRGEVAIYSEAGRWWLGRDSYTQCMPFDYVHQLQNIYFAFRGEELTIQ